MNQALLLCLREREAHLIECCTENSWLLISPPRIAALWRWGHSGQGLSWCTATTGIYSIALLSDGGATLFISTHTHTTHPPPCPHTRTHAHMHTHTGTIWMQEAWSTNAPLRQFCNCSHVKNLCSCCKSKIRFQFSKQYHKSTFVWKERIIQCGCA